MAADRSRAPVGALDHPRHDVLEPAEHRPALPRRLRGAVARVGVRRALAAPGAGDARSCAAAAEPTRRLAIVRLPGR